MAKSSERTCELDGCSGGFHAKGMCKAHYTAWYREQNPDKVEAYRAAKRKKAAAYNASRRKPPLPKKSCVICDAEFLPHREDQPTCPPTAEQRARSKNPRKVQSRCARALYQFQCIDQIECHQCGKMFLGQVYKADKEHKRRYCSTDCLADYMKSEESRWSRRKKIECPVPWTSCCGCGNQFIDRTHGSSVCLSCHQEQRKEDQRRKRQESRRWIAGYCPCCGDSFVSNQPLQTYCGAKCSKYGHRQKHGRRETHRKRARFYGCEYEPVSRTKVFERDGYVCQICGEETSETYSFNDPWSPTIDHIIPMSKQGGHLYSNVQCAHAFCNSVKNDGRNGTPEELLGV